MEKSLFSVILLLCLFESIRARSFKTNLLKTKLKAGTHGNACDKPRAEGTCIPCVEGNAASTTSLNDYIDTGNIDTCLVIALCSGGDGITRSSITVFHYAQNADRVGMKDSVAQLLDTRCATAAKWGTTDLAISHAEKKVIVIGALDNWIAGDPNAHETPVNPTQAQSWADKDGGAASIFDKIDTWKKYVAANNARNDLQIAVINRNRKDFRFNRKCEIFEKDGAADWAAPGDPIEIGFQRRDLIMQKLLPDIWRAEQREVREAEENAPMGSPLLP